MFLDCACGGGREEGGVGEGEGESRTASRAFPGTGFLTPSASTPGSKSVQARSNKQQGKAKQHSTPKAGTFPNKYELPRVGLEPTTL